MNEAIYRTVSKIDQRDKESSSGSLEPFSKYLEIPNIILLGDPGSGKTFTFRAAANKENAKFLSVREFLATEGAECERETVYLDGLDEYRSRIDDKNAIIEVIRLLRSLELPGLRLSCRVADWLGETDLSLFESYFRDNRYVVLSLEPLNKDEVRSILRKKEIEDTEGFVRKAEERGLKGMLANPQTLLMLADVVGGGTWPKTKLELYEKSVQILLTEHNRERLGPGLGKYSSEELMAPAGAACASILISGVAGISLLENNGLREFPSYRSVPFEDPDKVQACLMRRAFSGDSQTVSPIHRTIAEFIAAKWLASKVRNGLPIRRVQSLICIEGHPASELRGLHAWLATLLTEHATILIDNDPYGVLVYGDTASASLLFSDRKSLLRALEKLSNTDPWFHSSDRSDRAIGALSGTDMVDSFQKILSDTKSSFHLRSLVLDAIRNGPSLPQMRMDLISILSNPEASYHDRSVSVDAILRVIPNGDREVAEVFRLILACDPSTTRLRAKILTRIYASHFHPSDVVSVFKDVLDDTGEHAVGELWELPASLPDKSLPDILDKLCELQCSEDLNRSRRNKHVVGSAFSRMFEQALKANITIIPEQLWQWLKALYRLRGQSNAGGSKDDIRDWLSKNQPVVLVIFNIFYEGLQSSIHWSDIYNFQGIIRHSLPNNILAKHTLKKLRPKKLFAEKECFLYHSCGELILSSDSTLINLFEEFFEFADGHKQLQKIRNELCRCEIKDWRRKSQTRELEYERKRERTRQQNRANLELTKEAIRSGQHLSNLAYLAEVYFGLLLDIDNELPPIERLRDEIGDDLFLYALEGFATVIRRNDLPSPIDVISLTAKKRYYPWWYAVLAGMDIAWQTEKLLNRFSDKLLKSALAIAIECPIYEHPENKMHQAGRQWKECLFTEHPNLVREVFEDIAIVGLKAKQKHISVIYSIVNDEHTKSWRGRTALKLLSEFPSANPEHLRHMMLAAIFDPKCHSDIVEIAKAITTSRGLAKKEQRALWFTVGFLLDHKSFITSLNKYTKSRDWVIWTVTDILQHVRVKDTGKSIELSISQLEFLIVVIGEKFKNVNHPAGGLSGSQNPWDAAEFVRNKINALSANADLDAPYALRRLLSNDNLFSYHDNIRHAIANQAAIRREAEYEQPSWEETTEALRGGRPANMADLHALILDHIATLKAEIRQSNTDIYKMFWKTKARGVIDVPLVEDICRDRMIDLLKPRLLPLEIRIEPEGHMAADKRADIVVLPPPGQKLPLELKRDTHPDLWEACENQLERLYARDPEAEGYGIYVVFWFGNKRRGPIPTPPNGINRPQSAENLETSLRALIPNEKRHNLEVVVIDVTPAALPKKFDQP